MTMSDPYIDWTPWDKNAYPENTITCQCGTVFRSHSKWLLRTQKVHTRKPCPQCGKFDGATVVRSDPEFVSIGGPHEQR